LALRENEERYRTLFESCGDAVFVLSFTGRICSANPAATRMTGYSSAELLTMSIGELDFEPDAKMVPERLRRLRGGETLSFEITHRRKDGTTFPVEVVATPTRIGETDFILAFDRDISVRKETERERDRLWNYSPDPLCIAGYDGRLKQVNPAWSRILGWTSEELIGRLWSELVHPDDREARRDARRF
jgi:PAS domain S-box-containing protein